MTATTPTLLNDLLYLLPLVLPAVGALAVLLLGAFAGPGKKAFLGYLAAAVEAVAIGLIYFHWVGAPEVTFGSSFLGDMLVVNKFSWFFAALVMGSGALTHLIAVPYLDEHDLEHGELHALVGFATFGMVVMAISAHLLSLFLGLEIMSLSVYVLVAYRRSSAQGAEAGLKYFILGSFASAVFLFATAFVYGMFGTLNLEDLTRTLAESPELLTSPVALVILMLFVAALGFKIAAVPFHMWTPDAYQGAPAPVTGFMSAAVKIGAFAAMFRVLYAFLQPAAYDISTIDWQFVLMIMAGITMTLGNLVALTQRNVKRMLAYSSIAHVGYLLVGVAAWQTSGDTFIGSPGVLFYLVAYAAATLGAFGVLSCLDKDADDDLTLDKVKGLARRHPLLGLALAAFMFSLAGVPPAAGFFAKFTLFVDAAKTDLARFFPLVIIAVVNSAIGVYYYLKVVVFTYMKGDDAPVTARRSTAAGIAVAIALTVTLHAGVLPGRYMGWCKAAASYTVSDELRAGLANTKAMKLQQGLAVVPAPAKK